MVTLHEVITFLVSMQISISSLQTHNVNRCGRRRHLARKLSLRRKRSSPNVFEMAATETITSIILIKLIRVSLGTVRHLRRFKIVVIDIQITMKQMLRDFIGIRVNRAKKLHLAGNDRDAGSIFQSASTDRDGDLLLAAVPQRIGRQSAGSKDRPAVVCRTCRSMLLARRDSRTFRERRRLAELKTNINKFHATAFDMGLR